MIGELKTIVIDAPDIAALSSFYTSLVGWTQRYADAEWITLTSDDGWRIGLQAAPDHRPPTWPTQDRPQQAHLDFRVPDVAAATAQAVGLGATLLRENDTWNTLADPAGHPFDLCLNRDDLRTTMLGIMLDCPDAKALSTFYSELLGKPITYDVDGMVMIGEEGARPVCFQQVAEYAPPRWPDPAYPQQFHLDIMVDDIETGEQQALAIGATRLPGDGENWRVYADPAGKPFCLLWSVA
ncbi:MAG: VOC family protein [Hamadaea sp.]|uniref:VOC family protein n=1 Tax=Hamadaea sp. TaxID=2024425 RepID=UPI00185F1BE6|nr:VOC family protein [Hamadaea sp.]NUR69500.1 VOC family protein [Hamadaea sp.]NUT20736.1 VOC family protein [Hamadaea sp.]